MSPELEQLRKRFLEATVTSTFVGALRDLIASIQEGTIEAAEAAPLATEVLADASTIAGWDEASDRVTLVDTVATLYRDLSQPEDAEGLSRAADLRRALERWVATLPGDAPERVAEQLNTAMLASGPAGLSLSRLFMLRWAGFRSSEVEQALLSRGGDDDELGRVALHTLALLGPRDEPRRLLSELLLQRAESRFEREVAGALAILGEPEALDSVLRIAERASKDTPEMRRRAVSLVTELARRNPQSSALQAAVLEFVFETVAADRGFLGELAVRGDWLPNINSAALVSRVLDSAGAPDVQDHVRHLLLIRLTDLSSPDQLSGWGNSAVCEPLVNWATSDTASASLFVGEEWQKKEAAWDSLLAAQGTAALDAAIRGVETEGNPYLYRQLATRLAAFALPAVLSSAADIAAEDYDHPKQGEGSQYALRLGALRLLRSSPPSHAFEILSSWRFTYDGHALTEVVQTFAEVAGEVAADEGERVRTTLARMSEGEPWHRISAAGALLALEDAGLAAESVIERAARAVEEHRDPTERALLITGLERLPAITELSKELKAKLKEWSRSENQLLARNAGLALAGTGGLRTEESLLRDLADLERDGASYRWLGSRPIPRFAGALIGLMASKEPEAFRELVIALVETAPWDVAVVLRSALPHIAELGEEPRAALVDAVSARALKQSASRSETDWFAALADLSMEAFLAVDWPSNATEWMPVALVSLADVLRGAQPESDVGRQHLRRHLEFLFRSPDFAVRRAGYRAAVEADPKFANRLFASWAAAKGVDLRVRAAEASEWLPRVQRTYLLARLNSARARRVREAARRADEAGIRRDDFRQILNTVAEIDGSNAAVCSVWAHVEALRRAGDDAVAERLRSTIAAAAWPNRVKRWLSDVVNDIEKRWKSANKDWPSPWHRWDGAVEELDATLSAEEESISVRVFLWKTPADYGPLEWGGAVVETQQNENSLLGMREFRLELADGRRGKALREACATGAVSFVGLGPYPHEHGG